MEITSKTYLSLYRNDPEDEGEVCFVEHNIHKTGAKVYVCVYSPEQDEPLYYEPYESKAEVNGK